MPIKLHRVHDAGGTQKRLADERLIFVVTMISSATLSRKTDNRVDISHSVNGLTGLLVVVP
jgi:hypothetical protein